MLQISCLYETKYFSRNCSFLVKFVPPFGILGLYPWSTHGHSSYLGYQSNIYYHSGDFLGLSVKNVTSGLESVLTLWTQINCYQSSTKELQWDCLQTLISVLGA